jgi:hypothetical protein
VCAETVSLFPLGFNEDQSLQGENVGTGSLGTTYVLSGFTSSIPFTGTLHCAASFFFSQQLKQTLTGRFFLSFFLSPFLPWNFNAVTLVENPSQVVETFAIPSFSLGVEAACVVTSAGSNGGGNDAICQQIVNGGTQTTTIVQTVSFQPFEVQVTSGSALPSSAFGTATATSSGSASASGTSSGSGQSTITALSTSTSSSASASETGAQSTASSGAVGGLRASPASGSWILTGVVSLAVGFWFAP